MSRQLRAWLQQEINRRGWSQREFGRQANLSQSVVNGVFLGERNATADFCVKAAQALNVAPEMVLRLAGILPPAAPAESSDDSNLRELVELARNLPPEDRQQILEYVRFVYQRRKG